MTPTDQHAPGAGKIVMLTVSRIVSGYLGMLLAVVVVAILAAGYFFILQPKYEMVVSDLERINRERQDDLDTMKKYLARLQSYRQAYDGIDASRKTAINELLPPNGDDERLFTELEQLIRARGFEVAAISIETVKEKPVAAKAAVMTAPYKTVSVSLTVAGPDYAGLKDLLRTIERHRHLLDVRTIAWGEGGLSLKLDTYHLN